MSQVLSPLLVGVNLFVLGQSSITTDTKANRHTLNGLSGNLKKVWPYNVQIYWNALNGWGGGMYECISIDHHHHHHYHRLMLLSGDARDE